MMMEKHLHRLMYGLLFPAVLGTVFVVFLSEDLFSLRLYPRTFLGIVFVLHWSFEFVLSTEKGAEHEYSAWKFLTELALILVIYAAFRSLTPATPMAAVEYTGFYLCVAFIPGIFMLQDIFLPVFTKFQTNWRLFGWDGFLLIVALACWHGSKKFPFLATNDYLVYGVIGLGFLVSLVSFLKRYMDLARNGSV
uniref:Uncharacterized protein n=1 Tax=Candidatus Kentrum sp. LPFa TaxID=2126335 RepID=A0A450W195_9GAMM|nr:MAG: hypothetical protein BECKLPF1236A_GA0070988_1004123 [Candidatus Kentron sp. LPFa]VFK26765.1 MAG: hypothetical protein BECKLPF1236C_GA0070990_1003825 [Candidatus Kentron sp. LPFa]